MKAASEAYPKAFFHPNIFVRAGLLIATVVAVMAGVGLLLLIGSGR
ncbi:hypothetical protein MKQ70_08220 [Chitinophaga sedimenti]|nr:hypothetical protein [Chitinophaga sedimenti]MCK7554991.1 hypothetical protein [Chitinophaga sedimenti]